MSEKFNNFCGELRIKINDADKRIKDLKANAVVASEKAKVEARAQLAALENKARSYGALCRYRDGNCRRRSRRGGKSGRRSRGCPHGCRRHQDTGREQKRLSRPPTDDAGQFRDHRLTARRKT